MKENCRVLLRLLNAEIRLKRTHVLVKGCCTGSSDAADCLGVVVVKLFLHIDIARFAKLVDLHTEIASGGICFLTYEGELCFLLLHQEADHGKA